jgi:hypothetical protein
MMNKREFLIGSVAVAAVAPFTALAKPSTEEGHFKARVIHTTETGNTYSTATGKYRRVGNMVEISIPMPPLHGPTIISGLPFTA